MSMTFKARLSMTGSSLAFLALFSACGSADVGTGNAAADAAQTGDASVLSDGAAAGDGSAGLDGANLVAPKVTAYTPADAALDVPLNPAVSVTFSMAMDPKSLTDTTFTVTSGTPPVAVPGKVVCVNTKAVFAPNAYLAPGKTFTATVTTGAKNASGVPVAVKTVWTFTTGATIAALLPVPLGNAGSFALLAKSGISTVPISAITGDVGVSPAAATYITGFSLTAHASNVYFTSTQVTGKIYSANAAVPSPSKLTIAVSDMELALTDAAGRAPDVTELGAGNIGGKTLTPGVYKWGTGLLIPTNVTLAGSATDVWILQIAQDLKLASGVKVLLSGGAKPKNVFWQVSGSIELGTTSHLEGILIGQTSITLRTGASVNGRLLAQTAIAIDGATVVQPAP